MIDSLLKPWTLLFAIICFSCSGESSPETKTDTPEEPSTLISAEGLQLDQLVLPAGFSISVYARVDNARSMVMGPRGTLYVGNTGGGKIYAVRDTNGDFKADEIFTLAEDLRQPNGVAFKEGALYVAEVSKLWKYDGIEDKLSSPPDPELIYDDYPEDGHHGWKYIAFGPDGKLYIPVGAPCNICESKNELYASISRMNPDGTDREIFAHGVRNTVGFTWHPQTKEMWFTDNGRDWLGNDKPFCELNRVTESGQHFGYPYCHSGQFTDPDFGDGKSCEDYVSPAQNLGPHVAPLGLKFYVGEQFPSTYKGKIFIAEHGSWNRDQKIGYRVSIVTEKDGEGQSYETFISGWLDDDSQEVWGRPVDVLFLSDGSMLLSDDLSGTIYRISYQG
ncbi:MAG: sorbosone dehydrogenase family protein [Cyclobacteriaceae bacterium]|nr:sorbosone dehydrogenase family protein [Cyclobacteriaceae bacterium HetDA_MAG_MS6]